MFSEFPSRTFTRNPSTHSTGSLQKASPKMGRFSLNGPKTRHQSYFYEQTLQLIQSSFGARIVTLQNQEHTSVCGHKGMEDLDSWITFRFSFYSTSIKDDYTTAVGTWHLPLSDTRYPRTAATHPRCVPMQHSYSVCGIAWTRRKHFPQEQAKLCIPTYALLPKGLAPYGRVGITHTGTLAFLDKVSLCSCFLRLSWALLHPTTCLSVKGRKIRCFWRDQMSKKITLENRTIHTKTLGNTGAFKWLLN